MNDITSNNNRVIAIDTNFLVDLDIIISPRHEKVLSAFRDFGKTNTHIFITVEALLEYVHVITDSKRFSIPFTMEQALERVDYINNHPHINVLYPDEDDYKLCLDWVKQFNLGRKRLTDTLMASTYFNNGITELWTGNTKDFEIFGCFDLKSTVS